MAEDDEAARKRRADELRRAIDDAAAGKRPPASPREFSDREAREAAEEARHEDALKRGEGEKEGP